MTVERVVRQFCAPHISIGIGRPTAMLRDEQRSQPLRELVVVLGACDCGSSLGC